MAVVIVFTISSFVWWSWMAPLKGLLTPGDDWLWLGFFLYRFGQALLYQGAIASDNILFPTSLLLGPNTKLQLLYKVFDWTERHKTPVIKVPYFFCSLYSTYQKQNNAPSRWWAMFLGNSLVNRTHNGFVSRHY